MDINKKRESGRKWAAKDRAENPDKYKKENRNKYRKSILGYLKEKHYAIMRRCEGFEAKKSHLYEGLDYLSLDEFVSWAINNLEYNKLHNVYVKSNYNNKLAPSIDRIDTTKGYELSNMRWLTHSENSRLGAVNRWNKDRSNDCTDVVRKVR